MSQTSENDQAAFRAGQWIVRPESNELEKIGESPIRVESRVMEVLVCLLSRPGQVVTKEILLSTVWPNVFVSDDALFRCIREIRRLLDDDPREPVYIETIPKKGYRWIAPVELAEPSFNPGENVPKAEPARTALFAALSGTFGRLAGVLLLLSAAWISVEYYLSHSGPEIESIAVLPFVVLEPSEELEGLGVGLADSVAFGLSRLEGVRVISNASSLHYRGMDQIDPQAVARELGVRSLLLGKVAWLDGQLSISVELVDGLTNELIWGETFRGQVDDLSFLQQRVAGAVAAHVGGRAPRPDSRPALADSEPDLPVVLLGSVGSVFGVGSEGS